MKRIKIIFYSGLLFLLIFLNSCASSDTTQPSNSMEISATSFPLLTATSEPSETAVPSKTSEPTAVPTPTATPTPLACSIAFDSDREGNYDIFRMDPDGGNLQNLTNDPADDFYPAWSPDGSRIVFVSNRLEGEFEGQHIYIMNANGSEVKRLTEMEGFEPDWSPDGRYITFSGGGEQGLDIYIIKSDGSEEARNITNTPENDSHPVWSPDGTRIAWLLEMESGNNIFTMKTNGSDVQQVTSGGGVLNVWWSLDGQLVTMGWTSADYGCCNFVMDQDGSNVKEAGGKGSIQQYLPFWDADGNRVECNEIDFDGGNSEIYLIGEVYPDVLLNLTNNPAQDRNPDWPAYCGPLGKNLLTTWVTVEETLEKEEEPAEVEDVEQEQEIIAAETFNYFLLGYAGSESGNQQRRESFQRACDEMGLDCIYADLPGLLEAGVDAVVQDSGGVNLEDISASVRLAEEKGVPVFLLDAEMKSDWAYSITMDWHTWGESALGWMFEQMGTEGNFVFFDLYPGYSFAFVRDDLLQRYPDIHLVKEFNPSYDLQNLPKDISAILKSDPEIKGIWAPAANAEIIKAVKDSSLALQDWPLMLCPADKSGLSAWQDFLKEDPDYTCLALPNPPSIAYEAAYAAYYLLSGYEINPSALSPLNKHLLLIEPKLISNESLSEWWEQLSDQDVNDSTLLDFSLTGDEIRETWFVER